MSAGIARRYAKALFDLARLGSDGALLETRTALERLGDAVARDERLQRLIANPVFTKAQRLEAMRQLATTLSKESLVVRFVELLAQKRRLALLPEIAQAFGELSDRAQGRRHVRLRTARPLEAAERDRARQRFEAVTGQKIELKIDVEPSLLGGAVVEVGTLRLDGSVRGRLEDLRRRLVQD
jgi:F-type H+-transporting ATPase subunit delta